MKSHARPFLRLLFLLLITGYVGAQDSEQVSLLSRAELIELQQLISNQGTAIKTAERIIGIEDFAETIEDQGRYNTLLARSVSLLALQQNFLLAHNGLNRLYRNYLSSPEVFLEQHQDDISKYFGLSTIGEVFLQIPQYLIQLGRYEDAKSWLSSYLSKPQESSNIFLAAIHLARLLYIEGNFTQARQLLIQRFYPGFRSGNPSEYSEKALFLLSQIAKMMDDEVLNNEVIDYLEKIFPETLEYQIVTNQQEIVFELPNPGSVIPNIDPTLLVLESLQAYEYSPLNTNGNASEYGQSLESSSLGNRDLEIIQVGYFRNEENANRLLNRLVANSFRATSKTIEDGIIVYVPIDNEDSKNTTLLALKDAGFEGFLAVLPSE